MKRDDTRKPGRWWWQRSGSYYTTQIGQLPLYVKVKGNKETGYQYAVWELCGIKHFGENGRFLDDLDTAILLAERMVIGLVKSASHVLEKKKS